MTGFGVLASGGLAWCEGNEVVALDGLGDVFAESTLNALMALGPEGWADALAAARAHDGRRTGVEEARLRLPFEVADYVDFYSSLEHATNVGRLFRPGQEPLHQNWRSLPIGYHGRAGTVVVSGTDVVRPYGQRRAGDFGPTERLDVELELGFVVGVPGAEVAVEAFAEHVFGVVVVNDWSARDIQAWEYVPLGPFLGKSFQTSISAWVTPLALLEQRRVEAPPQEPPPLGYLAGGRDWALDLDLELELNGEVVSRGNARTLYWTMPQQLAHATSNGAWVRTGDLMATGAISGTQPGSEGSLLELWAGARFLADGDEVVLRARGGDVELGEVRARVVSGSNEWAEDDGVSFDHHDPHFVEDPDRVIGPIREEHPLVHSDLYGGFWLLTRYEDVTAAALDHESFTSAVVGTTIIPPSQPRDFPLLPIELDPPEHTLYRGLVNALFSKPRIEALRPELEALATRLLEPIAREGGGDVVAGFANPMSLGALARFMNLPEEDEERWFDWVERMFSNALLDKDDQREAVRDAEAYIDALIAERKESPRDDFIGMLLEAEVDGHRLSDLEVRSFGVLMLLAGYETTSGAIGLSLLHLAERPEQRAQLFADYAGLSHSAVNELLRFISPVQVFCRNAAHDLDVHGETIPAGDVVLLGYGPANHDPRAFSEPDRCILDRHPNRHVAFGHGRHLCLGANLARLELTIMIERVAELFPDFRLDPEHPPTWKPRGDIRGLASLHLVA